MGIISGRNPWKSSEKLKTAEKSKRNKINVLLPNDITGGRDYVSPSPENVIYSVSSLMYCFIFPQTLQQVI